MISITLQNMSIAQLLQTHVDVMEELRSRDVLRSANNPTGDLAEYLFCKAFGWAQAPNSQSGYDAVDYQQNRYQIKGRRIHARNPSRQLSAMRNLGSKPFDLLAGVLFDDDYNIARAALIPYEVILKNVSFKTHTNSHVFHLRDAIWSIDDVVDVTAKLKSVLSA